MPLSMQEMQVQSRAGKDTLEKEMATYSSVLGWKIPWTEEPGQLQSIPHKELDMIQELNNYNYIHITHSLCYTVEINPEGGL